MEHREAADGALDARLAFRLPRPVADAWRAAAQGAGQSLSDWLRAQVAVDGVVVTTGKPTPARAVPLRRGTVPTDPVPTDPVLVRGIAQAGNNLNQIARHLNAGGKVSDAQLLVLLMEIEHRLAEVVAMGGSQEE